MTKYGLIGVGFGNGAQITPTRYSPAYLRLNKIFESLGLNWDYFLEYHHKTELGSENRYKSVLSFNRLLCQEIQSIIRKKEKPIIIGGDHSIAMGSWSGLVTEKKVKTGIGMIWVDAHLDAHTPETSPSQAIHGMPVAHLLGEGDDALRDIGSTYPKIDPNYLTYIGIRSYEPEEEVLLKKKNVRIIHMEEVEQRGFDVCLQEAVDRAKSCPNGFGLSIDLDAFDPAEIPGVGSPEPNGIKIAESLKAFKGFDRKYNALAIEIVELNPDRDIDQKSVLFLRDLLGAIIA